MTKKRTSLRVLVACECSQVVTSAFVRAGCDAYSCDIQMTDGPHPSRHIIGDVLPLLGGHCKFRVQTGEHVQFRSSWDLIIAHPPCTYLTRVSAVAMVKDKSGVRAAHQVVARAFFFACLNAPAPFVCVENPVPLLSSRLPRPTTSINPFQFGEPWSKLTCLWLRGLPPLMPTIYNTRFRSLVGVKRGGKARSRFFPLVAEAMAAQWVPFIKKQLHYE